MKYLPTIIAAVTAAAIAISPQVQASFAHHPEAEGIAALLYAVLTHLLPSPVAK
jgi:hypothetical protein